MSALFFSVLAAGCAAISNLIFRKNSNIAKELSVNGYLLLFYFSSFVFSLIFCAEIWKIRVNFIVLAIGGGVGLLNVLLMLLTSRALSEGPAGLTFAFQNSSAVFPGILLFAFFGTDFGFSCSLIQFLGMALICFGLYSGVKQEQMNRIKTSSRWLKYALACLIVQILALTCIQGRCILFACHHLDGIWGSLAIKEADDLWFMPGQFGVAILFQLILFLREKRKLQTSEMTYGVLGGLANFVSTFFLLLATEVALPFETGILFPCFAVSTIILCQIWANLLYQENFNLKSNVLCACGVFIGMLK
jgi:hypothetical protein